jgi:2-C-methyl-D-erythritol 2,4-cyclodiphosphate synthase
MFIGGVKIDCGFGLLGHSDADVALHALMDALLGALALGDIGKHFPDNDPAYKGISSILLLEKVFELIARENYTLSNADITIIAQKPKLLPYIPEMRKNVAKALGCDISKISIKATTEEGLGFTGSGEAISAHAVCILQKNI